MDSNSVANGPGFQLAEHTPESTPVKKTERFQLEKSMVEGRECTRAEAIDWACRYMECDDVCPADSPSGQAWTFLQLGRLDLGAFMTIYGRLLPKDNDLDGRSRISDTGEKTDQMLAALEAEFEGLVVRGGSEGAAGEHPIPA
jgi:hypothetical protein